MAPFSAASCLFRQFLTRYTQHLGALCESEQETHPVQITLTRVAAVLRETHLPFWKRCWVGDCGPVVAGTSSLSHTERAPWSLKLSGLLELLGSHLLSLTPCSFLTSALLHFSPSCAAPTPDVPSCSHPLPYPGASSPLGCVPFEDKSLSSSSFYVSELSAGS